MTKQRILVVEDESRISDFVFNGLSAEGYDPTVVSTGAEALREIFNSNYALVILDLGLPDMDGFDVLKQIRAREPDLPVIILTARTSGADTVQGLTSGADDYVPKPFRFPELVARIRLRVKDNDVPESSQEAAPSSHQETEGEQLRHADLVLDPVQHHVTVGEKIVELSPREFDLATIFLRHPGQALTRDMLLSRVWGDDFDGASNVVDVYVRYLRNKLGAARFATVRGVGYRLVDEKHYDPRMNR